MKQAFRFLFLLVVVTSGCKEKSSAEKALNRIQKKAEETSDELKEEAKEADKEGNKKVKEGEKPFKGIKLKLK